MKLSRKVFLVIGVLIVISAVIAWYLYRMSLVYNESFENDFGVWMQRII